MKHLFLFAVALALVHPGSAKATNPDAECSVEAPAGVLSWLAKGRCDGGTPDRWELVAHGPGHDERAGRARETGSSPSPAPDPDPPVCD